MTTKWIGLVAVAVIAALIIGYRTQHRQERQDGAALLRVLLVADLGEAGSGGDACAQIIHDVRAARARGVTVQELEPNSKSALLTRYHVLTIPTVLILDPKGDVVSRYEGEGRDTVASVRSQLEHLQ